MDKKVRRTHNEDLVENLEHAGKHDRRYIRPERDVQIVQIVHACLRKRKADGGDEDGEDSGKPDGDDVGLTGLAHFLRKEHRRSAVAHTTSPPGPCTHVVHELAVLVEDHEVS